MIHKGRCLEFVLDAANHIEIRHTGLDHDHIGAFGQIETHFPERFVAVGGILLINGLGGFAEVARRADCIAEGTIEGTGVLGRISHDARVDKAFFFQHLADDADAAVHHVGGSHNVSAGLSLGANLTHEHFNGFIVEDVARFVDEAVLTVCGVGVKRHIAHDAQLRVGSLDGLHGTRNQTVGIGGFNAVGSLQFIVDVREKSHHRDAEFNHFAAKLQEFVDRQTVDAGHGGNGRDLVFAFLHEHRQDEVIGRENGFTHQSTRKIVMAHAAHTHERILSKGLHFSKVPVKIKNAERLRRLRVCRQAPFRINPG